LSRPFSKLQGTLRFRSMTKKIATALVGAGSMGGALLRGWLKTGILDPARSAVFDPSLNDEMQALAVKHKVRINPPVKDVDVDGLVLAVKPQMAATVLPAFSVNAENAIVISVMAGTSIKTLSRNLGGAKKISRVMPNLPAAISKGASGLYATPNVNDHERGLIERLMAAVGDTVWVESEDAIDWVTAVSGSGPAYYFLLTEALAEAGVALGLSKENAAKLARATAIGAGALLESDPRTAADIRDAVTSPGGTTEAALNVFEGDGKLLRALTQKAIKAAAKRAGELKS